MQTARLAAVAIFSLVYVLILAGEHAPRKLDRPSAALAGAVLMVLCGVLTRSQALAAIDMPTIALLLGMMIVVHYAAMSGIVDRAAAALIARASGSHGLLWVVCCGSAVLSALFVNDTVCLLMTPLILSAAKKSGVRAEPYLIALATSSNVGSLMTITGNPQNMLIGQSSGWEWGAFAVRMVPIGLVCLAINGAILGWVYRADLRGGSGNPTQEVAVKLDRKLAAKTLTVFAGLLIAFIAGANIALAALTAAVVMLALANRPAEETLAAVDWSLLLFFAGLFVVVAGMTKAEGPILYAWLPHFAGLPRTFADQVAFSGASIVGSNLFSNVPYVMLVRGWIAGHGDARILWLALAASSTLAGNLTLVGSVANLIVAQQARQQAPLPFMSFLKAGFPSTIATSFAAATMIWLMGRMGWV